MLDIELSEVSSCDCCGKEKLLKTFKIDTYQGVMYLGYKCCARWFKVNMSGNRFYALKRLSNKINAMSGSELEEVLCSIQLSQARWQSEEE